MHMSVRLIGSSLVTTLLSSLLSRARRATEVRVKSVQLSATARAFVDEVTPNPVRIIAHRPDKRAEQEYDVKEQQAREDHSLEDREPVLFLEVGHAYLLRYLFLGEGDTAPMTREVLRKAIPNPLERPRIHVG